MPGARELPGGGASGPRAGACASRYATRVGSFTATSICRELRRGPLDFMEVQGPGDVLQAVDTLRANAGLYHAMVTNGVLRGREFAEEATRRRWLQLLDG